jgi:hypothetical protein
MTDLSVSSYRGTSRRRGPPRSVPSHAMSKLLSARDLLDLVRQGQVEETGDAETVTVGTLGRKV